MRGVVDGDGDGDGQNEKKRWTSLGQQTDRQTDRES